MGGTDGYVRNTGVTPSTPSAEYRPSPHAPPRPTAIARRNVWRYAASMTATLTGPIGTPVSAPAATPITRNISTVAPVLYSRVTAPAMAKDGSCELMTTTTGPSVTWLGHASAVAELGGARVVFDPLLPW